jgi:integrase
MEKFDKIQFRELIYDRVKAEENSQEFLLRDLFKKYLKSKTNLKLKTKCGISNACNSLEKYKKDITIWDITPEFLKEFELMHTKKGMSPATVSAYFRSLRGVINYFMKVEKIFPPDYEYPFGMGGFIIQKHQTPKFVISNDEIKSVLQFKDFQNKDQEYARDIWELLFYLNGANYGDLFRMKWSNIKSNYIVFYRMKTETTRKNNVKPIVAPMIPRVKILLYKLRVKDHPYILGLCSDDFNEAQFTFKKDWELRKLNRNLKYISDKLNLSIRLNIKDSRDCYATFLYRNGRSKDHIGMMMGHANSAITEHYLAGLDLEKTWDINACLIQHN